MDSGTVCRVSFLLVILSAVSLAPVDAFAWRLFAGREECITETIKPKQWQAIRQKFSDVNKATVVLDIGFLVTTKHDVEDAKANVDYGVYSPSNKLLQNGNGVTDGEVELHAAAESQGPWKICFRVSGGKLLRPSVIVDISYFSITFEDYDGDTFEWEYDVADGDDAKSEHEVNKDELASHQQVSDIVQGLEKLDHYLRNVTNEQRFLYARTVRHLKTAQSTLSRTYSYYSFVYLVIILASMSQILVIRLMFKKSQRGFMMHY